MPDIFVFPKKLLDPAVFVDPVPKPVNLEKIFLFQNNAHSARPSAAIKGKRLNAFSTFCEYPQDVSFANQLEDEVILLFLRADLITNVPWIAIVLVALLVPPLVLMLLGTFPFPTLTVSAQTTVILVALYYLVVFGYALGNTINWFYNIGMVTTKRVLDLDVSSVTYKNVASAIISSIADVDYTQRGFFQTFFDFGDVLIQTESKMSNIEFEKVPQPSVVEDIVIKLKEQNPET